VALAAHDRPLLLSLLRFSPTSWNPWTLRNIAHGKDAGATSQAHELPGPFEQPRQGKNAHATGGIAPS